MDIYLLPKNFEKISDFQKILKNEDSIYSWDKVLLDEHNLLDRGLVDSHWFDLQIQMKREFEENTQEFLREQTFLGTVSSNLLPITGREARHYYREIHKSSHLDELKRYLADDYVGKPYIYSIRYKSTFVRIQHLYQVFLYEKLTAVNLLSNNVRFIEFGGGYGDLANLIYSNNLNKPTYIIIDLPVLCKIQFLYLSSIHKGRVFLISDINNDIKDGAINIVPLNLINRINIEKSIFWATYSLTESNFDVLDILKKKNFFGSEHYFIAYQTNNSQFMEGPEIANELKSYLSLNYFSNGFENDNYLYL